MTQRIVYGWQKDGIWYLSKFKNEPKGAANQYNSQASAIQFAESRGLAIEWLQ